MLGIAKSAPLTVILCKVYGGNRSTITAHQYHTYSERLTRTGWVLMSSVTSISVV